MILFLGILISSTIAIAGPAKKSTENSSSVMQLEAEVIEGEAKLPAIFLEFEAFSPTLDSVIYQRNDFNDLNDGLLKPQPLTQNQSQNQTLLQLQFQPMWWSFAFTDDRL